MTGAIEETAYTLSFADLALASDIADAQGDNCVFLVNAVTSGTLTMGGVAITPGVTTLSPGETLIWTPANNAHGTLDAFTVRAIDSTLASDAVQVRIQTANTDDKPTGQVSVYGTPKVGMWLTARHTLTDDDGLASMGFKWQVGTDGVNWTDITGATNETFLLTPDQDGKKVRVVATVTDVMGSSGEVASSAVTPFSLESASAITGYAYHWKSHALLSNTLVASSSGSTATTDDTGRYVLELGSGDRVPLTVTRATGDGTSNSAITSADALAALRIAVGLNPNPRVNGVQAPLLPYQLMAADVNNNGAVTSADALAVLRMAVKLPSASAQQWLFVEDTRDFWDEASGQFTLTRSAAEWSRTIVGAPSPTANLNLVGVLKGDVNGNWQATAGTPSLDALDPAYFTALAALTGVPESYFVG